MSQRPNLRGTITGVGKTLSTTSVSGLQDRAVEQRFKSSSDMHYPMVPGSKQVVMEPRPMDRPQGKMYLTDQKHLDGRVHGQRHFPERTQHLQPQLVMDRKIHVEDPAGSGVDFSLLRSGTYHFNDLYGNVRAECYLPHQSRTFSHQQLIFPTRNSVEGEAKQFARNKNVQTAPYLVKCEPHLQKHGVLRHGAPERHYQEVAKVNFSGRQREAQARAPYGGEHRPRTTASFQHYTPPSSAGSSIASVRSLQDQTIAQLTTTVRSLRMQ
jgi:hypothetical protein